MAGGAFANPSDTNTLEVSMTTVGTTVGVCHGARVLSNDIFYCLILEFFGLQSPR